MALIVFRENGQGYAAMTWPNQPSTNWTVICIMLMYKLPHPRINGMAEEAAKTVDNNLASINAK